MYASKLCLFLICLPLNQHRVKFRMILQKLCCFMVHKLCVFDISRFTWYLQQKMSHSHEKACVVSCCLIVSDDWTLYTRYELSKHFDKRPVCSHAHCKCIIFVGLCGSYTCIICEINTSFLNQIDRGYRFYCCLYCGCYRKTNTNELIEFIHGVSCNITFWNNRSYWFLPLIYFILPPHVLIFLLVLCRTDAGLSVGQTNRYFWIASRHPHLQKTF